MMLVRIPSVGSVISYSYLWKEEHEKGQIEGLKVRPCVVMVVGADGGEFVVAPITHSPTNTEGIELNHALKRRLGLDDEKSWLILTEVNIFRWRGPDVYPVFKDGSNLLEYGKIPDAMIRRARDHMIENMQNKTFDRVERSGVDGP